MPSAAVESRVASLVEAGRISRDFRFRFQLMCRSSVVSAPSPRGITIPLPAGASSQAREHDCRNADNDLYDPCGPLGRISSGRPQDGEPGRSHSPESHLRPPRNGEVDELPGTRKQLGSILDLGAPLRGYADARLALEQGPEARPNERAPGRGSSTRLHRLAHGDCVARFAGFGEALGCWARRQ